MKIVFGHPTGNANVKAAASSLMRAGLLSQFQTSIACFSGDFLDKVGAFSPFSEIRRRRFDILLKPVTHTSPFLEAARLLASKAGFTKLVKHEKGLLSVDAIYQHFDRIVASKLIKNAKLGAQGVYAYEDAAAFSFRQAKVLGVKCYYDLPIGYWRAAKELLESEQERWPQWNNTLIGLSDSQLKLDRKDEELRLADQIFVASQFTAKTLQSFPGKLAPIKIIPYGFPSITENRNYRNLESQKRLKLIFVGGLSQRKGIADLFAAVEGLQSYVELTVVGQKVTNNCPALDLALNKHKWIPSLPHEQVLQLMKEHDVLIFPSLFEGFGLVITEAMSQGTPVLTTDRTAGPDFIENNENGWLIEAGKGDELQLVLEKLLSNPQAISKAGKAARETARQRPWSVYGLELAEAIKKG
jgi:glycosyltransferase involved in cell wall biosynthesis